MDPVTNDAVWALLEDIILFSPWGPYTLEPVTKDAVSAFSTSPPPPPYEPVLKNCPVAVSYITVLKLVSLLSVIFANKFPLALISDDAVNEPINSRLFCNLVEPDTSNK